MNLNRAGLFKAKPVAWHVKVFPSSRSVAIAFEFDVLEEHDGEEFHPLPESQQVRAYGDWFVIKKNGEPNAVACKQLANSLGWQGSLKAVSGSSPPDCTVQIEVEEEVYNGKSYFKAGRMNPEDHIPNGGGANEATVGKLDAQFGSALRAATKGGKGKAAAKPPESNDDIPF